jgi:hypothetical protein
MMGRHSQISELRGRLSMIHSVPDRRFGFTTRDFMQMHELLGYSGRETFVRAINERITELGYHREGPFWTK